MSDPAVGILEFDSISAGIVAADAMVKSSPLGSIYVGTVHPGKYLVLVSGDTASVDVALQTGMHSAAGHLLDQVFLPDIHPDVVSGLTTKASKARLTAEAAGVVETDTVAAVIDGADAGVKAAQVDLAAISIADGLGGKGYLVFSGVVGEVEAAVEAAVRRVDDHGSLVRSDVIAQVHAEIAENLGANLGFLRRVGSR